MLHTEKRSIWYLIIMVFTWFPLHAQEETENTFSLSAQLRPKFELRDGVFRPLGRTEKSAALISDRTRFTMDYSYKNVLSIRISPQAVNVWGQENMVQGAEKSGSQFSIFEAWANLQLTNAWGVKAGRQVISLDDERFFGELDWAQGARAHDALSIHYNKSNFEMKSFFAYNQNYKTMYGNNLYNTADNLYCTTDAFPYKWMQTVWLGYRINEQSRITVLGTNLGFQQANVDTKDTNTNFQQTYGANYTYNSKRITATISGYYQTGENINSSYTNAYLVAAYGTYKINKHWSAGIGSDLVSGNNVGAANTMNKAFNPYFHTGHKFYGHMDYYLAGNQHKGTGLSDNYLNLNYRFENGNNIYLNLHQFFTPNTVKETTKTYSKNLGQEADLGFSYKVNKFTSFTGGYSFYLTTPTTNFLKNTPDGQAYQQWFWLSIKVNPTLVKSKF